MTPTTARIIDGKAVAAALRAETTVLLAGLPFRPGLAGGLVGGELTVVSFRDRGYRLHIGTGRMAPTGRQKKGGRKGDKHDGWSSMWSDSLRNWCSANVL